MEGPPEIRFRSASEMLFGTPKIVGNFGGGVRRFGGRWSPCSEAGSGPKGAVFVLPSRETIGNVIIRARVD